MSEEYDDYSQVDKGDSELIELLRNIGVPETSEELLLEWIVRESGEFGMNKALSKAIPRKSISEQIADLKGLACAASYISDRMTELDSLAPAMIELQEVYLSLSSKLGKDKNALLAEWRELEVRVAGDMKLLNKLSLLTQENLESLQKRTGRPSTKDRDVLFFQWHGMVQRAAGNGVDQVKAAMKGWNLYFVRDRFISVGAANQALERVGRSINSGSSA